MVFIPSRKCNFSGYRFNSQWEMSVFKTILAIIPCKYLPIKVNQQIPGHRLELDFYLPKLKLGFELQGPTHNFILKTICNDLRKAVICKRADIDIIYLYFYKHYSKKY